MRHSDLLAKLLCALLLASPLPATADTAGEFDYYVLSLSWSPNWCASTGDDRQSPQCGNDRDFGWVLHGLWPQHETGWPAYCNSRHASPTRGQTGDMADIMGSADSAWHQWNKHGSCTGLAPQAYFDKAREAFDRVARPSEFRALDRAVTLPARLVEEAFLRDNPEIGADGFTVTCRDEMIKEVRICMTRDLEYRDCGSDVRRDCALNDALLEPVR